MNQDSLRHECSWPIRKHNPFDRDAIDASLGHSEGDETEVDFSLHCTPVEDLF